MSQTASCGTWESCRTMPPLDLEKWIIQVNGELSLEPMPAEKQQYWEKPSIHRVPDRITRLNREAYRPQVVSFGPYHHNKDNPMEDHKYRVLLHFLRRSGKPLECFLKSLKNVLGDLEASYEGLDHMWKEDSDRFLQLMIIDGCFMLEILRFANGKEKDYAPNDPIFSDHGNIYMLSAISRDMLLLENQLPMLVLEELVYVCDGKKEDEYFNGLILDFLLPSTRPNNATMGKCLHVLDVFRKNMVQPPVDKGVSNLSLYNACMKKCLPVLHSLGKILQMVSKTNKKLKGEGSEGTIPPATELREHGIQFEQSDSNSLKDISFPSGFGVLRLPMIVVDGTTESKFLNLIAFERFHVGAGTEVTSYICLMDNLIDKGEDYALLRNNGIIENYMESDEAAATLFNKLAKDMMLDPRSSINKEIKNVVDYCKLSWPDWRANLMHSYFSNPWVILSVIAAFLLFGLATIQTVYTALGYEK